MPLTASEILQLSQGQDVPVGFPEGTFPDLYKGHTRGVLNSIRVTDETCVSLHVPGTCTGQRNMRVNPQADQFHLLNS